MNFRNCFALFLFVLIFLNCQNPPTENPDDTFQYLFENNLVEKQIFEISGNKNEIIESKNGTVISIPKGSFLDESGKPVEGKISIEFSEILTTEDMIRAGMTTVSEEGLIQSEGIFYINALKEGIKLTVDPEKPIHFQIPTSKRLSDVAAYDLEFDSDKNMLWKNPVELEKYLLSVRLAELDFLPEGFEDVVINEAPFPIRNLDSKILADSFYLLLDEYFPFPKTELPPLEFQEAYSNPDSKIEDGIYTSESFEYLSEKRLEHKISDYRPNTVRPASVHVLKSESFENTLIATREFEERMRVIHQTCDNAVLEIYVNNLDKNLSEIDELAAEYLRNKQDILESDFLDFANQKLTKVDSESIEVESIKNYYSEGLKRTEKELKRLPEEINIENRKLNEIAKQKGEEYKEILWQREKYRMEKYGLTWTKTGWVGLGKIVKGTKKLLIKFETYDGGRYLNEKYSYIVIPEIKSIFKVNQWEGRLAFDTTNDPFAIGIGYLNDSIFFDKKPFSWTDEVVEINLKNIAAKAFIDSLEFFNEYESFNQIKRDLEYSRFFHSEKKRREKLIEESVFFAKLRDAAFPCVSDDIELGMNLFNSLCTPCHSTNLKDALTGPPLYKVHERKTKRWFIPWVKNSQKMIEEGDPWALELWAEWGPTVMTRCDGLSDSEISAIYEYLKSKSE